MVIKICVGNYVWESTTMQFLSKSVWGFRFCACVISRFQSDSAIFLVLEKGYSRDGHKLESGIPNIAVFDPLLTRHAIQRMRSGRVRIFNGNQWEPL